VSKQYCPQDHDTYKHGRTGSGFCKVCQREKNARYTAEARRSRDEDRSARPVPGLRDLRLARGHSLRELAFESGLDHALIWRIEQGDKATYEQRVALFQAFNILEFREIEAKEVESEMADRRVRAGVA
jgi:hypothetical protein